MKLRTLGHLIVSANPDDPDCLAVRSYAEGALLAVADVAAEGVVTHAQAEALIAAGAVEDVDAS